MNAAWRRRLRPPRRLKTTREGKWFLALTIGVGIAAVNTGNNLLYIVLSANLSIVVLSGILSELTLRGIGVSVSQPGEAFAGRDALLLVSSGTPAGRRFPALSVDIRFRVDDAAIFARMPDAPPGGESVRLVTFLPRLRGLREIRDLSAATRFPFALFEKSLEPESPDPVAVFPTPDEDVPSDAPGAAAADPDGRPSGRGSAPGIRGIRDYAPGDPARDIQWKATARFGRRMVKEREGERAGILEIRLPEGGPGPAFERAVSRACGDVLGSLRAGNGFRIHQGGRVVVDGRGRDGRRAALRFLATVPPVPSSADAPSRKAPEARPGDGSRVTEPGGILRWLPRIFWGSGLLLLADAGVPLPFLAVAAAAFAAGLAMETGLLPPVRIPGLDTLLGAVVCAAAVADFVLGGRDPLRSGALLVLGIQSIRFLGPKRAADGWQLTAVTFLEYLAAAAAESGPRFALVAASFLLLCPGAMWSHHALRRAEEGVPSGPVPPRFAVGLLLAVAGAGIVMSTLLFAVTPRLRVGHLSRKSPAGARRTVGFSDTLSLRDMSGAVSDRRIAARVEFPGTEGANRPSAYLKGAVYSAFTGSQWRRGWEPGSPVPRVGTRYFLAAPPGSPGASEADVTLEPLDSPAFFAYGAPLSAEGPLGDLRADRDGNLLLPTADRPAIRYRIRFLPQASPPSGVYRPPREADTRMPAGDWSGLAALAESVAPSGPPDPVRAGRLAAFLRSGYRYTIEGSAEGIRDFLFVRKAGYCEHFATALCLMLRSAGIPSRVAAGFLGGEWNEVGSYLIVRQSDAHAWTEAWLDGRWVTLDATPAGRAGGLAARLSTGKGEKYLDWLRHRWEKYVVDYDLAAQAKGVEAIARVIGRARSAGRWATFARSGRILLPAAVAAALLAFWMRGRRRTGTGGGRPLPAPYARLFALLARRAEGAPPGIPPAEMLAKAAAGGLEADAARFTDLYHRDRFGAAPLSADARAEAFRLADRLREALARGAAR